MKIVIEGNPIPLQRARASKKGFYDPQLIIKRNIAHIVKEQFKREPFTEALSISLDFYMQIPVSWSKKKKLAYDTMPHANHKDLDNLIKLILDSLNAVVWIDDSIIYHIDAYKFWSHDARTILTIGEV